MHVQSNKTENQNNSQSSTQNGGLQDIFYMPGGASYLPVTKGSQLRYFDHTNYLLSLALVHTTS